ncbi:hypothetical protein Hanom_Chr09g00787211 [Helianthus anomalus]
MKLRAEINVFVSSKTCSGSDEELRCISNTCVVMAGATGSSGYSVCLKFVKNLIFGGKVVSVGELLRF